MIIYFHGVSVKATFQTPSEKMRKTQSDNLARLLSDAAYCKQKPAARAALCGVSPLPASSGKTNRHRLNRGGNRQANATLHQVVVVRLRWCGQTKDYAGWRMEKGRSESEIMQCLKPFIVREAFHTVLIMLKLYSFVI